MRTRHWIMAALVAGSLPLASCKKTETAEEEIESPAKVEHLAGDQPARITLTEDAVKRIDLKTSPIAEADEQGAKTKTMPYSALLYDTQGDTWIYANPQPLTYVREHVQVKRIDGDQAILAQGPAVGTQIVSVGAAELYGSEQEFEEE